MVRLSARALALALGLLLLLPGCSAPAPEESGKSSEAVIPEMTGPAVNAGAISSQPAEPPAPPEPQPRLTREDVEEALDRVMEDYSAAAVSVATIESGQLSQSGAWGWAVQNEREMIADTKMRVASLSKVAVGMCAMAMAQEGILDLDAPLSTYWGESVANPYSQTQPSVRTLLSHSSSLKDLEITRGLSHLTNLLSSASTWRAMEPGDGGYWYYSNFGVCVLGTTLELASGQMLDEYFQTHFCQPMGLRASFHGGTWRRRNWQPSITPAASASPHPPRPARRPRTGSGTGPPGIPAA